MKEGPILFSAPMVNAILEDRKTQTRRVVKLNLAGRAQYSGLQWHPEDPEVWRACPYGVPGDLLWVRETHQFDPPDDGTWGYVSWAGCDASTWRDIPPRFQHPRHVIYAATWQGSPLRMRPSIHMPRWASRITLKVTEVRVERLQEISEKDIVAEGATVDRVAAATGVSWSDMPTLDDAWRELWSHINGADSWAANPWVWVVSFERVKP